MRSARFALGQVVATHGVLEIVSREEIGRAIGRHHRGDWGLVPPEDAAANDQALIDGARLISSYDSLGGNRFWIITEADRSATTVLLPSEY